ncbi:hypothetical protein B566_EDAN010404 [Ephemera danica]|nr:hypothetical protein B566_EDAN010404 [Ephemera danica]
MATTSVFATVGTTQFDKFVQQLTSSEALKILKRKGYDRLTVQIGNGKFVPTEGLLEGVHLSCYRFKDSLSKDMAAADLILSHAGAGSCLEALEAGKPLLVVVNEDLMDNHQTELAEQFCKEGFLYYCNCKSLPDTLQNCNFNNLKQYVKGDPTKFAKYLDELYKN